MGTTKRSEDEVVRELAADAGPLPYPAAALGAMLRVLAQRFGERPALIHEDGRLTYRELAHRSAVLARGLLAAGVTKGSRVALLAPNGVEFVVSFFAIVRAGGIAVGVNTFYKERELAWTLRHCDAQHLVCVPSFLSNPYLDRLESAFPALANATRGRLGLEDAPYLRAIHVWGGTDRPWASPVAGLEAAAGTVPERLFQRLEDEVSAADLALLIYTSGSTAEPRGAFHSHGAVVSQSWNLTARMPLEPGDVVYNPAPLFWVGGLSMGLLVALHQGATLAGQDRFEPGAALRFLQENRVTVAMGWPHFGKAMATHPDFPSTDLSALRGGTLHELLPPERRPPRPDLRSNALGMTETCGVHSMADMSIDLPERLAGVFGKPMPGMRHKIVDPETGERVPPGELGEICVRGRNVLQGLCKLEREEVFDDEGFFRTGDMGFFDDEGWLHFAGRDSEMIKTAGANVSAREVELALAEQPGVKAAYVVGLPDETRGALVAAAIVPEDGVSLRAEELSGKIGSELAAYKKPKVVTFLTAEEVPLKDTGKVDKRALVAVVARRVAAAEKGRV